MDALEAWVERAGDPARWRALAPDLTISEGGGAPGAPLAFTDDELTAAHSDLYDEGWFHLGPRLEPGAVARLAAGIAALRARSIPPVFAFVYDEPWRLSQQAAPLLRALLGDGFKLLPAFWAWHLDAASRTARGWGPHRDRAGGLSPAGTPLAVSIWVALTEATPWNGCMYVVPAHADPGYRAGDRGTAVAEPQAIQPLPAEPGTIMGWTQSLLHWGGRSTARAGGPRISFSIEYQRGDVPPLEGPLLAPDAPPPFAVRLGLIGRMLRQYQHMVDLDDETLALADRLAARHPLAEP